MKQKLLLIVMVVFTAHTGKTQSSSPNYQASEEDKIKMRNLRANESSNTITFSEYSSGTYISDQYQSYGIIFGGDSPFITYDGANPTSPVLSGSPIFSGAIEGTFVDPVTGEPVAVQSFSFDAGYFDSYGSTRVEWFDKDGNKLGQQINSILGIETLTMTGGNITSWRISVVENEPAGFAIDNVSYETSDSQILFREKRESEKDGSWGFGDDEIPGFDHVGFHANGLVYESHPGYDPGNYWSFDGDVETISSINGVQAQHTLGTFEYYGKEGQSSTVKDFEQIQISDELAARMLSAIETVMGNEFQLIAFDLDGLVETLSPAVQKGGGGTFTCVGLVEWAAEQAGHNDGEGFILNSLESVVVPDPRSFFTKTIEIPLLSPQLLNYAMKSQQALDNTEQWVQGFFDPVDFMITDPLGRRLGYTLEDGLINEIPNSFYSGDGDVEIVLIPKPIPGPYSYELVGKDDEAMGVLASVDTTSIVKAHLGVQDRATTYIMVEPKTATAGDVNEDSQVDEADVIALIPLLNTFTDGLGHPGDLDGDGLLSYDDVDLLEKLVGVVDSIPAIDPYEPAYLLSAETLKDRVKLGVFPNPVSQTATLQLDLGMAMSVKIKVFDIFGKEITQLIDEKMPAGSHLVEWHAVGQPAGVYIYKAWVGETIYTDKILLER